MDMQNNASSITDRDPSILNSVPYAGALDFGDRMAVLKTLSNAAGIRLPDTIVPEGESLIPYGEEKKRALETEIAALPDLADGLMALRARIAAEKHRDVKVPIQQVRMNAQNGGLYGKGYEGKAPLAYTDDGLGQIVSYVKPGDLIGVKGVLKSLPVNLRSDVFNHYAENNVRSGTDQVFLRTALDPKGRRLVRAAVSEKHSKELGDDQAVARVLAEAFPKGGKVRITRTWDRTDIELLFPMMAREIKVGDVVMGKVHITNSETKGYSLRVGYGILRTLCLNFTTAWAGGDTDVAIRHMGDVGPKLAAAVREATRVIDPFVQAFGDAYKVALPDFAPTRGEVLTRVGERFGFSEHILEAAASLWNADGQLSAGDTLAGLSNALTRASQRETIEAAAAIEKAAGRVVVEGWGAIE